MSTLPYPNIPVCSTHLQLSRLADKAKEAKAAAVMAIIGRSPPPKATAEGRGKDSKEGLAKSESHSECGCGRGGILSQ